jgi:predicted nucleotidyltransferase
MAILTPSHLPISLPEEEIEALCARWKIRELALFGSVIRDDFRPDSDVDVLVTFFPDAGWSLLELTTLQEELEGLLGRRVDLIEKAALRNPFRRHEILRTHQVVYAA